MKPLVLVYQMGKVGSSSVYQSLLDCKSRPDLDIRHQHYIVRKDLAKLQPGADIGLKERIQKGIQDGEIGRGRPKVKIITLTRRPTDRNISAFFQNHASYQFNAGNVAQVFQRQYPHGTPLEWFDRELKALTGIDVYQTPFPKAQGYQTLANDHFEVLIVRMEDLDRCHTAIRNFLGIPGLKIQKRNVSSNKPIYQKRYGQSYNELKAKIHQGLSPDYHNRLNTARYTRHFY